MLRKLSLVAVAAASLGAAALAPTSSRPGGGWPARWRHHGVAAPARHRRPGYRRRLLRAALVPTPWGPAGGWSIAATDTNSPATSAGWSDAIGLHTVVVNRSMDRADGTRTKFTAATDPACGNISPSDDCYVKLEADCHECRIRQRNIDRKTSRSICDAVGERLQQNLRPLTPHCRPICSI